MRLCLIIYIYTYIFSVDIFRAHHAQSVQYGGRCQTKGQFFSFLRSCEVDVVDLDKRSWKIVQVGKDLAGCCVQHPAYKQNR